MRGAVGDGKCPTVRNGDGRNYAEGATVLTAKHTLDRSSMDRRRHAIMLSSEKRIVKDEVDECPRGYRVLGLWRPASYQA